VDGVGENRLKAKSEYPATPCSLAYACVRIRRLVRWGGRL
jgi:hypothetical protein